MSRVVKKRRYDSRLRQQRAAETQARILDAARALFTTRGYAGTSVHDIAREAEVSVDTLYGSVGRKPELLLAVHDMLLAEADAPLVAEQRGYVKELRAAPRAADKLLIYAQAMGRLLPQTVPLLESLRVAGESDAACRATFEAVVERRANNMKLLVAELRATGEMRPSISDDEAATLIWSMNSPEYFSLLSGRGVSAAQYVSLVADVWTHTLLAPARVGQTGEASRTDHAP